MRCDAQVGMLSWWSCQSPVAIAAAFWIIQIVSMEECSRLTQNSMQICCSTHSVILNAMATQYTCSLNGIYCPPLTSTVKSSLFVHVHSSPLSLAAGSQGCCANRSYCINNGCTFSGKTDTHTPGYENHVPCFYLLHAVIARSVPSGCVNQAFKSLLNFRKLKFVWSWLWFLIIQNESKHFTNGKAHISQDYSSHLPTSMCSHLMKSKCNRIDLNSPSSSGFWMAFLTGDP